MGAPTQRAPHPSARARHTECWAPTHRVMAPTHRPRRARIERAPNIAAGPQHETAGPKQRAPGPDAAEPGVLCVRSRFLRRAGRSRIGGPGTLCVAARRTPCRGRRSASVFGGLGTRCSLCRGLSGPVVSGPGSPLLTFFVSVAGCLCRGLAFSLSGSDALCIRESAGAPTQRAPGHNLLLAASCTIEVLLIKS